VAALLVMAMLLVIPTIQPDLAKNFDIHPSGFVLPTVAAVALLSFFLLRRHRRHTAAFIAWSLFLAGLLGEAAWGLYPRLLIATKEPALSLTVYNAAAPAYGLQVGLLWFGIGLSLVLIYTFYVYRCFWGTVTLSEENEH
jgi:cytochrome bd ubiquinol oxidase subunit II